MVSVTVTTTDAALARKLEPLAPRPDLRLRAVAALARAGVATGIGYAPILPLLNDRRPQMEALAQAAAGAGAQWLWGGVLFLSDTTRPVFFAFLEREFPHLLAKYKPRFEHSPYLRGDYPARINERLAGIRARYGLHGRGEGDGSSWVRNGSLAGEDPQMSLRFG